MKKILLILAVFTFVMSAAQAQDAPMLVNNTRKMITVKSADNSYELPSIAPRKPMSAPFLKEGENSIILYYYEGMKEVKVGLVKITMKNNKASVNEDNLKPVKATEKKEVESFTPQAQASVGTYSTELLLRNKSSHSIIILTGPFAKLALAAGQSAKISVIYPLGQTIIVVKIDFVNDSSDNNKGRKYRQSVISSIITQDQKYFDITDGDLSLMGGAPLWRRVQNNFVPFQFVSGPWLGDALAVTEVSEKAQLQKGFNSFAIQWVAADGVKWQADAEMLVTSKTKIIKINEAMLKNKMMVKQY